jgi:hypothetical protein
VRVSSPEEPVPRDVLSSLPRTRPQRRSSKRDGETASKGAAPTKPAAKPKAKTAPKTRAGGSKSSSARATPRRVHTPKAAASPPPKPAPAPQPEAAAPRSVEPPSRTDVLAGAVQAASELAQAGLAVGGELIRVALSRLPRP